MRIAETIRDTISSLWIPDTIKKSDYMHFWNFRSRYNQMVFERSYLLGIFDREKDKYPNPPANMTSVEMQASRYAFCILLLHQFKIFYLYAPPRLMRGKPDETEKMWEHFLTDLLVRSTGFREIVESGSDFFLDSATYQTRLKVLSGIAGQLQPLFEKLKAGEITEEEYSEMSKVVLKGAVR
jgi:hypothetical protein